MSTGEYDKWLKCNQAIENLLSSYNSTSCLGYCSHIFCINCFKNENLIANNNNLITSTKCPCCKKQYYEYIQSIEEAALIGEAAYLNSKAEQQSLLTNADPIIINNIRNKAIEKLGQALLIIPSGSLFSIIIFKCLVHACLQGLEYCRMVNGDVKTADPHILVPMLRNLDSEEGHSLMRKVHDCCLELIDKSFESNDSSLIHSLQLPHGQPLRDSMDWYHNILASLFRDSSNIPATLKHAQLAYDYCLRLPDHSQLAVLEHNLQLAKDMFDKEPPLRFAVGDEVEFLVEEDATSEWKLGKVVELYYRERDFPLVFTAPYRLQLLDERSNSADQGPVYVWVKADLDRYVRKPGVRSTGDTRYQAMLDAKVEELAHVYCSKGIIRDIYLTLKQDREFVKVLKEVWYITLSEAALSLYRMLVMYRQPLVRTESGYHVPTAEEVIAGIRAFFDPADRALASSSAVSDARIAGVKRIKAIIISWLQLTSFSGGGFGLMTLFEIECKEAMYMLAIFSYPSLYSARPLPDALSALLETGFTVPLPSDCTTLEVSEAVAKIAGTGRLESIIPGPLYAPASIFLIIWNCFINFLDKAGTGLASECPCIYFFVKFCLDQGAGVPKPALAVYDRMNMQLSREFIRCANPTCELNRLDQSTGLLEVKFKKCSRCQAVIYCSRECQVAHFPQHKKPCRDHSG